MAKKAEKDGPNWNELDDFRMRNEIFCMFGLQLRQPLQYATDRSFEALSVGNIVSTKTTSYKICGIIGHRSYRVEKGGTEQFYMKMGPIESAAEDPQIRRDVYFFKAATSVNSENRAHFLTLIDRGRCEGKYNFFITKLADINLDDLRVSRLKTDFRPSTALALCAHTLQAVHDVHCCEFIHRNIQPANFVIGLGSEGKLVYMVNFSLAYRYSTSSNFRKDGKPRTPKRLTKLNTTETRYQSRSYHREADVTRLDDLESWLYMCVDFFGRRLLPWKKSWSERETFLAKEVFFRDGCEEVYHIVPKNLRAAKNGIDRALRSEPIDYTFFAQVLISCSKQLPTKWNGPFEWQEDEQKQANQLNPKGQQRGNPSLPRKDAEKQSSPMHPVGLKACSS